MSVNHVILKGNVGQDPKITDFQDGGKVANFTLATTERGYTTKDGREIPDATQWHNITVKKTGLAKFCEQYVKKGTPLLIMGMITYRTYQDNSGQTRYVTEILAQDIELCGQREHKEQQGPAQEPEQKQKPLVFYTKPEQERQNNEEDNDDLPF